MKQLILPLGELQADAMESLLTHRFGWDVGKQPSWTKWIQGSRWIHESLLGRYDTELLLAASKRPWLQLWLSYPPPMYHPTSSGVTAEAVDHQIASLRYHLKLTTPVTYLIWLSKQRTLMSELL